MELFLDKVVQLNIRTDGRDKIARLIQYACRALWDINNNVQNVEFVDKLKTLEFLLSSFRKLLRFGRCIDVLHAAQRTIHLKDITLRFTLTLSKISQALFLYADHILWLSRSGMVKSINAKKWSDTANKYWFVSIVMNLCRDFYELSRLIEQSVSRGQTLNKMLSELKTKKQFVNLTRQTCLYVCDHREIFIDTMKNACDLFIPLTALGYTKLKPRTVGLLGVISSLAAIAILVQPNLKLTPA